MRFPSGTLIRVAVGRTWLRFLVAEDRDEKNTPAVALLGALGGAENGRGGDAERNCGPRVPYRRVSGANGLHVLATLFHAPHVDDMWDLAAEELRSDLFLLPFKAAYGDSAGKAIVACARDGRSLRAECLKRAASTWARQFQWGNPSLEHISPDQALCLISDARASAADFAAELQQAWNTCDAIPIVFMATAIKGRGWDQLRKMLSFDVVSGPQRRSQRIRVRGVEVPALPTSRKIYRDLRATTISDMDSWVRRGVGKMCLQRNGAHAATCVPLDMVSNMHPNRYGFLGICRDAKDAMRQLGLRPRVAEIVHFGHSNPINVLQGGSQGKHIAASALQILQAHPQVNPDFTGAPRSLPRFLPEKVHPKPGATSRAYHDQWLLHNEDSNQQQSGTTPKIAPSNFTTIER
jgi:hypothetical protein